ncbi:MAG: hypothetical protein JXP48_12915 [Acidobacteria bacterium]|nr:hypothetical protein [Acidobacteriota bacterium]
MRTASRKIFVWSYGRGTIQYDIICILILAFIFLVPRGCFVRNSADLRLFPHTTGTPSEKDRPPGRP